MFESRMKEYCDKCIPVNTLVAGLIGDKIHRVLSVTYNELTGIYVVLQDLDTEELLVKPLSNLKF